jgi:hypothetical protein
MRIFGPDRTLQKNRNNIIIRNFPICIFRHIRLSNDGCVAAWSKAWVCGPSPAGTVSSKSDGGTDVLSLMSFVLSEVSASG